MKYISAYDFWGFRTKWPMILRPVGHMSYNIWFQSTCQYLMSQHNIQTSRHKDLTSPHHNINLSFQTMTTCHMLCHLTCKKIKLWQLVRSVCWLVKCYVDFSDKFVVSTIAFNGQEHVFQDLFSNKLIREDLTSQQKDLTRWHKDLTSQHNNLISGGRNMPPYYSHDFLVHNIQT